MSDEDITQVVGLLGHDDIREIIERNFDFDRHAKLIRALFPQLPKILRKTGARRLFRYVKVFLK
jgi:hypothetical protein